MRSELWCPVHRVHVNPLRHPSAMLFSLLVGFPISIPTLGLQALVKCLCGLSDLRSLDIVVDHIRFPLKEGENRVGMRKVTV